jgi:hypothetical protein
MAYQTQDRYKLQYFTGVQASIWIGEAWVTECFGISFQATQNIIPIFGYASTTFDAVAKGRVLVQGSFEINFIDEGYLYYVLHKMNSERIYDPSEFNESKFLLTGEAQPITEVGKIVYELSQAGKNSDKSKDQVAAEALLALADLSIVEADRVVRELDILRAVGAKAGLRNDSRSIIYDIIPFNIQGIFGNPEMTKDVTDKRLINCFLVSNEMIVSVDDEPLKERYSFIGQVHK